MATATPSPAGATRACSRPAGYGYAAYMPQGAHGCFVDYQGNIWLGGNGDGIVQEYNPHAANDKVPPPPM